MKCIRCSLVVGTLVVTAGPLYSHHAFTPVYDGDRTITVTGVVTEFRLVNPHAMMSMDVTDDAGKIVKWTVEFAGRLNLTEVGWTPKTLVPGERVTVSGNPTHTNSARMFFRKLVKPDGTELLPSGAQRDLELEELRRQRARDRTPQR
jgi:hypothetical protein